MLKLNTCPLQTSAQSPVPVRTVLQLVGGGVSRLGRVWVEGQIAELTRRGDTVFLTLRDPVAAVSVRVICPRAVLDATDPPPGEGARVLVWAKPDFNTNRGLSPFRPPKSGPWASANCWPGWNGSAGPWPLKAFSRPSASARSRSCPAKSA